jgi:[FeFe] hydrogenase H-cluster maturation GTPase HydF
MAVNNLSESPNAVRVHIALFGKRNSGKSSLINAITGQEVALVSDFAGTTTDPVFKPIEMYPIGPCVFIDTAGFDDEGKLGDLRVKRTREILDKTDLAIVVFTAGDTDTSYEEEWIKLLKEKGIPFIAVVNKIDLSDIIPESAELADACLVSAETKKGISGLKERIVNSVPADFEMVSIAGHLISEGDAVLLVAPQDIQAPKGRLILPQVQTIRDLLDHGAVISMVTADKLDEGLNSLKNPPQLIITDSQVFPLVYAHKPNKTALTSFSMLMARYKGDIDKFVSGADTIENLKETDKVLILEACSHNPLDGDIGRIKIPNMLKKLAGEKIQIDIMSGNNFPENIGEYALVIHCGGCMFNRRHMLSRVVRCVEAGVPITNYGVFIAKVSGILDKVVY